MADPEKFAPQMIEWIDESAADVNAFVSSDVNTPPPKGGGFGCRVGEDVAILTLTVPDVPISSIRFFTGEIRSQRCSGGRSELLAEGAALGGC